MSMAMNTASHGSNPVPYDWPHRDVSSFYLSGGINWHIQRMGQGKPMLLLHGTAASTHTWRDLMPILARSFDVWAIDLPGHGFTDSVKADELSLQGMTASIAKLLRDLDIRPEAIIGHSAGAAIALNLALSEYEDTNTVIGINAALLPFGGVLKNIFSPLAKFFASTSLMPRMLVRRAKDTAAVERVLHGTGSRLNEAGLSLYQRLFQRESHLAAVLEMMARWDLRPMLQELPHLQSRLLLIVGEGDKAVSPGEAVSIKKMLPDAEISRLPGLGHLAHEERPEEVAAIILGFLDKEGAHA